MLSRRHFNTLLGSVGITMLSVHQGRGQSTPVVRMGNAAGIIDPQITFLTVGQNKRTPFFEQEGVKLDIINMSGVGQTMQSLAAGNCETSAISPVPFLNVYAKNPAIDIIFPYCWLRQPHWSVAVKPDSPVKSLQELKGKTIGIRNTGDSGYFFLQAVFKQMGIDPQKDVEWLGVGAGGPAGQALYRDAVQAIAIWDVEFVRIEIAGFKLRHLPNPASAQHLFGNTYLVNKNAFEKDKATYGRFLRAIAKGQIFTALNPGAAVRLHWDLYPETKPKGKTDEESFKEMIRILEVRRDKWFPQPTAKDQRMGALDASQWEESRKFIGLLNPKVEKVADVNKLFTTELLDEANKFDRKAFEEEAKKFKYA